MTPLRSGAVAPAVPGVAFGEGPVGLFFFKVTCPTCQLAAPTMRAFERAFPGRVIAVGQDRSSDLEDFRRTYGMEIRAVEDAPPYVVSDAYGIVSVPTLFLIGEDGIVLRSVGSWDRTGFNLVAETMGELVGSAAPVISTPDDGLPAFKPG